MSNGSNGRPRPGADGLLAAATQAFYEIGYGGTTVRTIAARANVTVAALYHHFSSKHEILVTVMRQVMANVLDEAERVLAQAGADPAERLRALVAAHVRYHISHKVEAFVSHSELRSLQPPSRSEILDLRDRYETLFSDAISRGVETGVFSVEDPRLAARAVISMCTAVSSWFRPDGPLSAQDVQRNYVGLALQMVGHCTQASGTGTRRRTSRVAAAS